MIHVTTFVSVPEAAVYEDDRPVLGKADVRLAGQPLVVYPIPEPQPPDVTDATSAPAL